MSNEPIDVSNLIHLKGMESMGDGQYKFKKVEPRTFTRDELQAIRKHFGEKSDPCQGKFSIIVDL